MPPENRRASLWPAGFNTGRAMQHAKMQIQPAGIKKAGVCAKGTPARSR